MKKATPFIVLLLIAVLVFSGCGRVRGNAGENILNKNMDSNLENSLDAEQADEIQDLGQLEALQELEELDELEELAQAEEIAELEELTYLQELVELEELISELDEILGD